MSVSINQVPLEYNCLNTQEVDLALPDCNYFVSILFLFTFILITQFILYLI